MSQAGRRRFLSAAGALLAARLARAQQAGRVYRVGVLVPFSVAHGTPFLDALRAQLAKHGFIPGDNMMIDVRTMRYSRSAAREHGLELVRSKVDALFALTTIATLGAQDATRSVPIVFSWVADPVASGIVGDYARPGGNISGVTNRFFELVAKRFELVRELLPDAKRAVALAGVFDSTLQSAIQLARPTIERLGLNVVQREAGLDWAGAISRAAADGTDAVIVLTPFYQFGMRAQSEETVRTALERRLCVVYSDPESVELGGLLSYATSPLEDIRRGADYLARVLRGEAPANLAIDQASRFELVVNLKNARAIGLTLPPTVLARADRVIE